MDELFDEVSRKSRRRMITIAAWFNGLLASTLLVLLLRCQTLWREDTNTKWNERLKDWQEQAEQSGRRQIQEADRRLTPTLEETQKQIDSLSRRLDTLKAKRS